MSDLFTTGSWDTGSEASHEGDANHGDEEGSDWPVDEEYLEEDAAADAWLAIYPGGSRLLYPQLFVVKPRGGKVVTPSRDPNTSYSVLQLPPEIRTLIYENYFDRHEEVKLSKEEHALFPDRHGRRVQRIGISSENVELKFWLSTALLQTSRQLRFEAMPILFKTRVITVEWLPVLPRFMDFLGKEGCAMIHYLEILDSLNVQGDDNARYQDIVKSISHLPRLQHLRIVLSWGMFPPRYWTARITSWFEPGDCKLVAVWTNVRELKKHAVPKMRSEAIGTHWPEYEILKGLKATKFTLAVESILRDRYLEFDRKYGAYPELSKSMQYHPAYKESTPPPEDVSTPSILPEVLQVVKAIVQPTSRALTPPPQSDNEDSDSPTWQDTDNLVNKTIPVYNFICEYFRDNNYLQPPGVSPGQEKQQNLVAFPTALKSTGSIMRDCTFCYLSQSHCGYHAIPNQPPFEPIHVDGSSAKENSEALKARFEDMSYVDMREVCRCIVQRIGANPPHDLIKPFLVLIYLGWVETPMTERFTQLDAAVEAGWTGKRLDKEETPPWNLLYRELRARYKSL